MGNIMDVTFENFQEHIKIIGEEQSSINMCDLKAVDTQTTIIANESGQTCYEEGKNVFETLNTQLEKDVINLQALLELMRGFDEAQGQS